MFNLVSEWELPVPAAEASNPPAQHDGQLVDQLRNQVAGLRIMVEELRRGLEDLRQDRDAWREAFQATQRQLTGSARPRNTPWLWWPWRRAG